MGNGITVDAAGQIYIVGNFGGTGDFDPGTGVANLTATAGDVFILKLSNTGSYIWAKKLGGTGIDAGNGIAVDPAGNVITSGTFLSTVDFDPGPGTANLATNGTGSGGSDIFINKLDAAGNYVWAWRIGGNGSDVGYSIATDVNGNVYSGSSTAGNGNVAAPGFSLLAYTSATGGSIDGTIAMFNAAGALQWLRFLGGTGTDGVRGMAIDASGNVYSTGNFTGTADFDPGTGTANLISNGANDIFVSKLDKTGAYLWAKGFGSTGADVGNGIAADGAGSVYTTGSFIGTANFDPNGSALLTSSGPGTASSTFIQVLADCQLSNLAIATVDTVLNTLPINGNMLPLHFSNSCGAIAKLLPTGAAVTRVSGAVTAKVYVYATAPLFTAQTTDYYVRRTYDINPAINADNATGTLTLYYTQADFDDYNTAIATPTGMPNPYLQPIPAGPADASGISNIRVTQYHGTSATGLPGSYTTSVSPAYLAIIPSSVVWNSAMARWEVTFPVTGFGGFFIHGSSAGFALPVKLESFTAAAQACKAALAWRTGSEVNFSRFDVEYSADNIAFTTIATVKGKNNANGSSYKLNTAQADAKGYYRLKIIDTDGRSLYSPVVPVAIECNTRTIAVSPNPTSGMVTVSGLEKGDYVRIYSLDGKLLATQVFKQQQVVLDLAKYPKGLYTVGVSSLTGKIITTQIVKK